MTRHERGAPPRGRRLLAIRVLRAGDSVAPVEYVAGVGRDPVETGAAVDHVLGGGTVEGPYHVVAVPGIDDVPRGLAPGARVDGVPATVAVEVVGAPEPDKHVVAGVAGELVAGVGPPDPVVPLVPPMAAATATPLATASTAIIAATSNTSLNLIDPPPIKGHPDPTCL